MRTTINLPDELLEQVRRAARESGRTMTEVIREALQEAVLRTRPQTRRAKVRLPTAAGAPRAGVDLDDSARLADLMDDDAAL